MKFLDEDLIYDCMPHVVGYNNYQVKIGSQIVFTGTFYAPTLEPVKISLDDIMENYRFVQKIPAKFVTDTITLDRKAKVNVSIVDELSRVYASDEVYLAYRYTNADFERAIIDAYATNMSTAVLPMLQSVEKTGSVPAGTDHGPINTYSVDVLPHYPFVKTTNYGFISNVIAYKLDEFQEVSTFHYVIDSEIVRDFDVESSDCSVISDSVSLEELLNSQSINAGTMYLCNEELDKSLGLLYEVKVDMLTIKRQPTTSAKEIFINYASSVWGEHTREMWYSMLYDAEPQYPMTLGTYRNSQEIDFKLDLTREHIPIDPETDEPCFTIYPSMRYVGEDIEHNRVSNLAIFDECPAKFYLMWQDRFGSIQSQGFDGKIIYSEDIEHTTIMDRFGHDKAINHLVAPKWELNTKNLTEEQYRVYESIFVSPELLLYNTELDKSYKVLATGKTFTEKTWKNQKKMFNFTLEVALDKKQNLLQ